jgi:hypothetical protein
MCGTDGAADSAAGGASAGSGGAGGASAGSGGTAGESPGDASPDGGTGEDGHTDGSDACVSPGPDGPPMFPTQNQQLATAICDRWQRCQSVFHDELYSSYADCLVGNARAADVKLLTSLGVDICSPYVSEFPCVGPEIDEALFQDGCIDDLSLPCLTSLGLNPMGTIWPTHCMWGAVCKRSPTPDAGHD